MNPHFFTAPFCLLLKDICKDALLLCLHLVQGSRFRVEVAASPPFFYWGDARKWHLSHQSFLRYERRNRLTCLA